MARVDLREVYDSLDEGIFLSSHQIRDLIRIKRKLPAEPPTKLLARLKFALKDPGIPSIELKLDYLVGRCLVEVDVRNPESENKELTYKRVEGTELVLKRAIRFAY